MDVFLKLKLMFFSSQLKTYFLSEIHKEFKASYFEYQSLVERILGALRGLETYLRLTMTQAQINHVATHHFHHHQMTKTCQEWLPKLFVEEQNFRV